MKVFWDARSRLGRLALFLVILGLLLWRLSLLFTPKWITGTYHSTYTVTGFYAEPRGKIDVLFLGSSHYEIGISPLDLWHQKGITSYSLATPRQSPLVSFFYIQEARKYQPIKVVVIEANLLCRQQNIDLHEDSFRSALDYMPLSRLKVRAALDIVSYSREQSAIDYLLPLLRYHSRWPALKAEDFRLNLAPRHSLKGFVIAPRIADPLSFKPPDEDNDSEPTPFGLDYFGRIAAYCKGHGIALVLVQTPDSTWTEAKHAHISAWAERWQVPFIDYNMLENQAAIHFDANADYWDARHINYYGAVKLSEHLSGYLAQQYGLENHRADPAYADWDTSYEYYAFDRTRRLLLPDSEPLQYRRLLPQG